MWGQWSGAGCCYDDIEMLVKCHIATGDVVTQGVVSCDTVGPWAVVMWQAFGCVASMFLISPKLTGLIAVVVTAIVTAGSLFGSVLRQLSRNSQAQVF